MVRVWCSSLGVRSRMSLRILVSSLRRYPDPAGLCGGSGAHRDRGHGPEPDLGDADPKWRVAAPGATEQRQKAGRPGRRRPHRVLPFQQVVQAIQSGLSVTDDLGQAYRLRPIRGGGTPNCSSKYIRGAERR